MSVKCQNPGCDFDQQVFVGQSFESVTLWCKRCGTLMRFLIRPDGKMVLTQHFIPDPKATSIIVAPAGVKIHKQGG